MSVPPPKWTDMRTSVGSSTGVAQIDHRRVERHEVHAKRGQALEIPAITAL